jgi:peptidoglycan/LPS O-acetylase OafA/YrhL
LGFPIVCLVLRKDWILTLALALLALSLPASRAALAGNGIWQEKAYLPGMGAIAVGILGARLAFRVSAPQRWILRALSLIGSAGIVAVLCLEDRLWRLLGNGTILLLTFSTTCLLLFFSWSQSSGNVSKFLGTGWLRSCGRLSYEIYLTHMFVVWFVVDAFKANGSDFRFGIFWYAPAIILSWFLGWLVARSISIPAEQALRRGLSHKIVSCLKLTSSTSG